MHINKIAGFVGCYSLREKWILKLLMLFLLIFAIWVYFSKSSLSSPVNNALGTFLQKVDLLSRYPGQEGHENTSQFAYYLVQASAENSTANTCLVKNFVGPIKVNQNAISFESLESKWGWRGFDVLLYDQMTMSQNETTNTTRILPFPLPLVWMPYGCRPQQTVAIVIPFRNRHSNLSVFLNNMIPLLRHQQLGYSIFVVHQSPLGRFNRGAVSNIGFVEALKLYPYDCFIFHDVDQLPEDDRNLYSCENEPVHLSSAMDKHSYRLLYGGFYGGVIAFTPDQYRKIEGFPNVFFGWGGEDDVLGYRASYAGVHIKRRGQNISRYTMLKHTRDAGNPVNPDRFRLLKEARATWKNDTYKDCKYTLLDHGCRYNGLFYELHVELLNPS